MILEVIFNDIFNQIISKIFFSSKIFSFQKRKTSTPSSHHSGMHSLSMSQSALMFFRTKSFPATRSEYAHIKAQLEAESFPPAAPGGTMRTFQSLGEEERAAALKKRLQMYCQKVYKRERDKPATQVREAGICMRENPFYVDTVKDFRDRRYEYKALNKQVKNLTANQEANFE